MSWVIRLNSLGVRIDSGDLACISKKVRQQLDEAGFPDAKIYASMIWMKIPFSAMQKLRLMFGAWVPVDCGL